MKYKFSFFERCIFIEIFVIISSVLATYIFIPIYKTNNLIIPYAIHPFNICIEYPIWWKNIKIIFIITYVISNIIIANTIYSLIKRNVSQKNKQEKINNKQLSTSELTLYVGKNEQQQLIYIPEKGLYQNILITRNNRKWKN